MRWLHSQHSQHYAATKVFIYESYVNFSILFYFCFVQFFFVNESIYALRRLRAVYLVQARIQLRNNNIKHVNIFGAYCIFAMFTVIRIQCNTGKDIERYICEKLK